MKVAARPDLVLRSAAISACAELIGIFGVSTVDSTADLTKRY